MMDALPTARPGTAVRILATTDLGAAFVPLRTSYGTAGTCAGLAELLEWERESQPTLWLDAGDLAVGPVQPLLGRRPWQELAQLPVDAAAAGNHEFDEGVPALRVAAGLLPYPLLCANVDVGLPASTIIDTSGGPVGVVGVTHPFTHRFAVAPPPLDGWPQRVAELSVDLRADGARWVVVLLHDGVDWWPQPGSTATGARSDRLAELTRPWISSVDLVLGGHTPAPGWAHSVVSRSGIRTSSRRPSSWPTCRPAPAAPGSVAFTRCPADDRRDAIRPSTPSMRRPRTSSGRADTTGWAVPARRTTFPASSLARCTRAPGRTPGWSSPASTPTRARWTARWPRCPPGRSPNWTSCACSGRRTTAQR
ncbi:hypothetical protein EAD98_18495 [Micromonospora sp. CV4]|nr:hypothetical protein EAD98_18495 [Micromonospora sp. CV4]